MAERNTKRLFVMSIIIVSFGLLPTCVATGEGAELPGTSDRVDVVVHSESLEQPVSAKRIELVGQIGGRPSAVAVQRNYAYLGVGPRLMVLDVSGPDNPTLVGQTAVLPNFVQDIYVAGDYVYVALGDSGLRVIDVSDPATPVEAGAYDTPGTASGVHVADDYVYVAAGLSGLRVIDISDPAHPMEISAYD
jgi:hypothetical protein